MDENAQKPLETPQEPVGQSGQPPEAPAPAAAQPGPAIADATSRSEASAPETPAVPTASSPQPVPVVAPGGKSHKMLWVLLAAVILLLLAAGAGWWYYSNHKTKPVSTAKQTNKVASSTKPATTAKAQGLQLDANKNYGNKYANGLLPVGDGKYTTSVPKAGYVYACGQYAQNLSGGQGGAGTRGPWFTAGNTEYDISKKAHVQGNVMWTADFSNKIGGSTRTVVTNDLPNHPTGTFPIASTDPAYQYDRNPNSIKGQTLTYALPANPAYNATPNCMGGESGIMLTGVALFNAFDAGGRDAGAWEVQDGCQGHPDKDSIYHYHTLSGCIKDVSVHTVIGYALDGFPITGPDVGTNNVLTTADLDECHGITSQIMLDGKSVTMYHYVMTQDFPYSVSCFRGTAITPPDLALAQQSGSQAPAHP